MGQLQFRSDDTIKWQEGFGNTTADIVKTSNETATLANTSCIGTSGTYELTLGDASTFSDGDIVFLHQTIGTGANGWQLNKILAGGGTTTLTLKYPLMQDFVSGAQIVGFLTAKNFTINAGVTISVPSFDGTKGGIYPLLINGITTLAGTIQGSGNNGSSGTGNPATGTGGVGKGGSGGDAAETHVTNTSAESIIGVGPSPGGASYARLTSGQSGYSGGSGGGNGTAGTQGTSSGDTPDRYSGAPGGTTGNAALTLLPLGSGGSGAAVADTNQKNVGGGGAGGCIVVLITKTLPEVTGNIYLNGGQGGASPDGDNKHGGGGSGGSGLLKCQVGNVGTNKLVAVGGSYVGSGGGLGGDGRWHVDYLTSITGTTSPTLDSRQDASLVTVGGIIAYEI